MRTVAAIVVVAIANAAIAAPADKNPYLARARVHLAAIELDLAAAALDEALATGDNDPGATAAIHGLGGVVAATRGDAAGAEDAFARALAIDPGTAVDAELGPKIVGPFEAARARLAGARLAVHVVSDVSAGTLTLIVDADPAALVVGGRAAIRTAAGVENEVAGAGASSVALAVPMTPGTTVTVSALDARGNRLIDVPWRATPATAVLVAPPPTASGSRRAWIASPWLWAGVAGVAAATGTVFALQARATRDDLDGVLATPSAHTRAEAEALDDRGARQTLTANVAFGVAAGAAIAAAALWWRTSPDDPTVTATATPSGGMLAIGARW